MFIDDRDTWQHRDRPEGNITCKPGGTFIGPRNITFVVSDQYGKSKSRYQDNAYSVNSKGQLFMYHTLPELTSVSPNVGSIEGGTYLKIKGNSFDPYGDTTQVKVGGAECKIVKINNDELTCKTPAQADMVAGDAGTRGLKYEMWVSTEGTGDMPANDLDKTAGDYRVKTMDGSKVSGAQFGERNGYTAKLSGYLVGPYDGEVSFYLATSGFATLYVSNNSDPANVVRTHRYTNGKSTVGLHRTEHRSQRFAVKKGEFYYFEAHHVQKKSQEEENLLQVYFWLHQTNYHYNQVKYAQDERQQFRWYYDRRPEIQRITLNNMNSAASIKFSSNGQIARDSFSTEDAVNKTTDWKENFDKMLTVQCTYLNTKHFIKQDYEDTSYSLAGQHGYSQSNRDAYCGRIYNERGTRVFRDTRRPIDALRYKWFCFAAKGETYKGQVILLVNWQDSNKRWRLNHVTTSNVFKPSNEWQHACYDMEWGIRNNSWMGARIHPDSYMKIWEIHLPVRDGDLYYQRDEVTISELPVEIDRQAAKGPFKEYLTDATQISVNAVEETTNAFDFKVYHKSCLSADYDFPLLGIEGAEIQGLNFDGSSYSDAAALAMAKMEAEKKFLRENENVTFTSTAWGSGTVTVERTSRGSRAPSGSYTMSYLGKEVTITDMEMTSFKMEALLATEFGISGVLAQYWNQKCYSLSIPLSFGKSTAPGDVDTLQMNITNLVVDSGNGWKDIRVAANIDGGYHHYTPGGDFFRRKAEKTEVEVRVNDFLSFCSTTDCSFAYDETNTPELAAVTSGLDGDNVILTITGTKFTTGLENYEVMVGDTPCMVQSASTTEIKCLLAPGPAGTFPLEVIVKSKGKARQPVSGQLTHTVSVKIISNSPSDGSIGGGTTVNVTGTGFPNNVEAWNGNSVTIGGFACSITESTFNWFVCVTSPSSTSGRRKRSSNNIEINFGGQTTTGGSYNYEASKTPSLTSFTPASSTPLGGGILTIVGTNFGAKWGKVHIGSAKCELVTWITTQITCKIPRNVHGQHDVLVTVPDNGNADTTGVAKFAVDFKITDVTPKVGSTLGGTKIRIEGKGFGDCSNVTVNLGSSLVCDITDCTDTKILCTTRRLGKIHKIDNGGKHSKYGLGYVWNPSTITIRPGDTVNWLWSLTSSSSETGKFRHSLLTVTQSNLLLQESTFTRQTLQLKLLTMAKVLTLERRQSQETSERPSLLLVLTTTPVTLCGTSTCT